MSGKIESGQLVTVRPIADNDLITPGTIVLCRVGNKHYLHIVKAVRATHHERFLIGNNRGYDNGWISMKNIFGVCTAVEP
jgi:SOS-response transcriptional repressor LexA